MHFYLSCNFASLKVSSVNNESINLKLESDMGTDKGISRREALARIGMIVARSSHLVNRIIRFVLLR